MIPYRRPLASRRQPETALERRARLHREDQLAKAHPQTFDRDVRPRETGGPSPVVYTEPSRGYSLLTLVIAVVVTFALAYAYAHGQAVNREARDLRDAARIEGEW